ncbi:MAG: hypothetical protein QM831_43480 [Kofleriaceae bacterium]
MAARGDGLIVLAVDWDANAFRLYDVDARDPKAMTASEFYSTPIPEKRSLRDCEAESALLFATDGRLLVNFYFNHSDRKPLCVFRDGKLVSEHAFDDVEREAPFADLPGVATADELWRLFDRNFARLAIVGDRAIITNMDCPTTLHSVDREGHASKPVMLSKDGLNLTLAVSGDIVIVGSSRGLDLVRIGADGSLDVSPNKRGNPKQVFPSGGYLLVNERYDEKKPPPKQYCLDLCQVVP